jgi:hypothetical protein
MELTQDEKEFIAISIRLKTMQTLQHQALGESEADCNEIMSGWALHRWHESQPEFESLKKHGQALSEKIGVTRARSLLDKLFPMIV